MKWVILGLAALATACAVVPKVEAPDCPHFFACREFCAATGRQVRVLVETEMETNCRCTRAPLDPS